jgi:hypothetical protein
VVSSFLEQACQQQLIDGIIFGYQQSQWRARSRSVFERATGDQRGGTFFFLRAEHLRYRPLQIRLADRL